MRKVVFIVITFLFHAFTSVAQLANGSTAPDFTFIDINGNTQNLYSYLNAGKYVALDVYTTWCHPCWLYHSSGVMDSLYTKHDIPGDQTWKVMAIEGDANTTLADLQGTGTNTQGDWVTGSLFPIMNPTGVPLNDFLTNYNIVVFPTLYLICPNKKVYQDTLNSGNKPPVSIWEYVAFSKCGPAGLDDINDENPLTIYPNPANDHTVLYFSLNLATNIKLSVTNIMGQVVSNYDFGELNAGDHSLHYNLDNIKPGIYLFTVSNAENRFVRKQIVVQ